MPANKSNLTGSFAKKLRSTAIGRLTLSLVCIISVAALLTSIALAVPGGDLDTSFNGTGQVTTPFGSNDASARAVAIQPDGKIVAAGDTFGPSRDFALARYNVNGSLDSSFDGDGKLTTDFGSTGDAAYAVAIQSDGKIVAAGNSVGTTSDFALARYNLDGSLDTSFGGTGKVTINFNGNSAIGFAIAIQPDGKIIVAGNSSNGSGSVIALTRCNTDGSVDTLFGSGGRVMTDIASGDDAASAVILQPDGKIIAAGSASDGSANDFALARYNPNGSLDLSFDGDGIVKTDFNADDKAYAVALQIDGKLIAVGYTYNGSSNFALARYNSNGALDSSFNGTGKVITDFGSIDEMALAVAIQSDGKIIAAGYTFGGPVDPIALARYNPDGSPDTSFGSNGKVTANFSNKSGSAQGVAIQTDGKIVTAGSAYNGSNLDFGLARFLPAPGALSFSASNYNVDEGEGSATITLTRTGGTDNKVVAKVSLSDVTTSSADYRFTPGALDASFNPGTGASNLLYDSAVQADGKVIISGVFTSYNGVPRNRIARLNTNGSLDTTFDPGTGASGEVQAVALQADGKIVIGGSFTSYNGTARGRIARLNADGSLDTTFNTGASGFNNTVYAIAVQPDGKIIIVGDFTNYNNIGSNRIMRLNVDGSDDATFKPGAGADDGVREVALQADGKIIVGGFFTRINNIFRTRLARLNASGALDTTFDPGTGANSGVVTITVQADGKIIIGGAFSSYNNSSRNRIARLNTDGSLDTTFDPGTGADSGVIATALQADGKIVIGGAFNSYNATARNRVARLNPDGSLDTTFNPGTGVNSSVLTIALQADGKIILGGSFTGYSGTNRNNVARLDGDLFVTWAAGDSLNKTITLPITPDSILESNETLTLSLTPLGGGATIGAIPVATLTIIDGPILQLSQSGYVVGEAGGSAQIIVTRTNAVAAAAVDYATSDSSGLNACSNITGLASSRCDYATSIGKLRFAAGESTKTIFIPIVDDNIADGNETFTITLSNPTGASFGSTTTATITITDNANTAGNPIDQAEFFIRQHYIDFLGREPEPQGLAGWLNVYNNCGVTIAQPCDRIEISSAFFRSPEFQDRAYFIYRFYSAVGKIPLYEGFMPDFAKVSGFLSAQQLEENKVAFVQEFMTRSDYQSRYGSIGGNLAYVTVLLDTLGLPNHPRKTEWVDALNGGATRATVLRSVTEDGQVYQKYYNEAFVIMQYFGYLRRSADISYLNWIQTMNSNGGDYRQMIDGFMNSAEYRNRFQ